MYDLVIRNATIVNGSGLPRYGADVGIIGNRIEAICRIREEGAEEVDATGQGITPGFIDGHTHMDAQLFWDPPGSCSCRHGVTTVVMGPRAFEQQVSSDDPGTMEHELRDALRAGAIGFTTSRSDTHRTPGDGPVASLQASFDPYAFACIPGTRAPGIYPRAGGQDSCAGPCSGVGVSGSRLAS